MVDKMKKKGFTLAEALIVLLVLSIFFAAGAKVFTQKKKKDKVVNQHGQFECWSEGGNAKSQYIIEGVPEEVISGTSCKFTPTLASAIYHIYVIYGNQGYGMHSVQNINRELYIKFASDRNFLMVSNKNVSSCTDESECSKYYLASGNHSDASNSNVVEFKDSSLSTGSNDDLKHILEYMFEESNFKNGTKKGIMIIW